MILEKIIVFTPIYVSIFWSIVFFANHYSANKPRYFLGVFMATTAILYICHAFFFLGFKALYLKTDSLYLFSSLSVFPLYYIYVLLLTRDTSIKKIHFIHFLPAIILGFSLLVSQLISTTEDKLAYYQSALLQNNWPLAGASLSTITMSALFFTSRLIFGIQAFVYLLLGYSLAKKYNYRIANFYSNLEGRELVWVKLLSITFLITALASIVANIAGRGSFMHHNWLLAIPSLVFSTLLFTIGLLGNKQNFTVKGLEADKENEAETILEEKENVYCTTNLLNRTQQRNETLKREVLKLLKEKKIYLNPELKITEMCKMLSTNRTYLSGFINQEFELSFNELINSYRVHQAVSILKTNNNDLTLNDIAIASGFGSVSSLNRVFKNHTGSTISHYKQKHINTP
ncbi:helix-turn-helix domain-containing protein [Gelatiniphilus marinus]|uniref:Helix-turn-helix domain-containing protein n=1 Tax=Gelatiniphilus marinus TaxID=1759464 RepID=A0ABW5JSZ9_9FLAO